MQFDLPRRARIAVASCALFLTAVSFTGSGAVAQEPPTPDSSAPPAAVPPSAPTPSAGVNKPAGSVENSVVKVFSTMRYPDPYKPWTKQAPSEVTGSGVVIDGKRILTNAHVVLYASQVQVQANQAGDKMAATVEAVAPGIDLAVLKLDDETFFDSHPALPLAKSLPEIKDGVLVYGYPQGGTSLSITKGIVSRIEFTPYNYYTSGLRIQIDAAINPGNSGGPAVVGDQIIGLAFSHLGNAENIGYIIPSEEIELFLRDIADGHYDGKPALYDDLQTLENPALRTFLKLDKSVQGMIVHHPFDAAPDYPLKEWDLITKIGDTPVDDQGMVRVGSNLRVRFAYLVQKAAHDGKVPLTIIHDGKETPVEVPAPGKYPQLVPSLQGAYPSYFVYGPMVFSEATLELVGTLRSNQSSSYSAMLGYIESPLVTRISDKPAFEGERLVVVSSPFFPHRLSKGYGTPFLQVVRAINGKPVKNLAHLVELLREAKDDLIIVEYERNRGGETMVFPRKEMMAATDEILTDNGVRSQGSPDTMAVWNAAKEKP